jgi:hypothetical protein
MARVYAVLFCVLAALAPGCRNSGQPERIPIRPGDMDEIVIEPVAPAPADDWDQTTGAATLSEAASTVFVPESEAKVCPSFDLYRADNSEFEVEPGEPGIVEPQYVTILVFWKMERLRSRMLARYVSDLAQKYRQWRVRAVGIVEENVSVAATDQFQQLQGLAFRIYYDLYGALGDLRDAIGAEDGDRPVAAVFIIDRKMRLRFYRSEFNLVAGMVGTGPYRPGMEQVGESAPPGKSVEDYLVKILKEG